MANPDIKLYEVHLRLLGSTGIIPVNIQTFARFVSVDYLRAAMGGELDEETGLFATSGELAERIDLQIEDPGGDGGDSITPVPTATINILIDYYTPTKCIACDGSSPQTSVSPQQLQTFFDNELAIQKSIRGSQEFTTDPETRESVLREIIYYPDREIIENQDDFYKDDF